MILRRRHSTSPSNTTGSTTVHDFAVNASANAASEPAYHLQRERSDASVSSNRKYASTDTR